MPVDTAAPETKAPAASAPAEKATASHTAENIRQGDSTLQLNPAERKHWLKTGELPAHLESVASEDKVSAVKAEPESKTGAASETDVKAQTKSDPAGKLGDAPEKGSAAYARSHQIGRKINDQIKELKETTAKVEAMKAEAARLEASKTSPVEKKDPAKEEAAATAAAASAATVKPKLPKASQFKTWDEYESALDTYHTDTDSWWKKEIADSVAGLTAKQKEAVRAELDAERKEQAAKDQAKQIEAQNEQAQKALGVKFEAAEKRHKDFADAVFESGIAEIAASNPEVDAFILDSEYSAEILYRLGKDLPEAERIAGLGKFAALRAMMALENEISSELNRKRPMPRGQKPPTEVGGQDAPSEDEDDSELSFTEYSAKQNARELARKKAAK